MIRDLLHEEYETADGDPVFFRCTECGYRSQSLGGLHAHCERHRGFTRFNLQPPVGPRSIGDVDALMELTEVVRVEETSETSLEAVEGRDNPHERS